MGMSTSCIGVEIDRNVLRAAILDSLASRIIGYAEVKRSTTESTSLENLTEDLQNLWSKLPEKFTENSSVAVSLGVLHSGVKKGETASTWLDALEIRLDKKVRRINPDQEITHYCDEESLQEVIQAFLDCSIPLHQLVLATTAAANTLPEKSNQSFTIGSGNWWSGTVVNGILIGVHREDLDSDDRSMTITTDAENPRLLAEVDGVSINSDLLETYGLSEASLAVSIGTAKALSLSADYSFIPPSPSAKQIDTEIETEIEVETEEEFESQEDSEEIEIETETKIEIGTEIEIEEVSLQENTEEKLSPLASLLEAEEPISTTAPTDQHIAVPAEEQTTQPAAPQPFVAEEKEKPEVLNVLSSTEEEAEKTSFLKSFLGIIGILAIAITAGVLAYYAAQRYDWFENTKNADSTQPAVENPTEETPTSPPSTPAPETTVTTEDAEERWKEETAPDPMTAPSPINLSFTADRKIELIGSVPTWEKRQELEETIKDFFTEEYIVTNNLSWFPDSEGQTSSSFNSITVHKEELFVNNSEIAQDSEQQNKILLFVAQVLEDQPMSVVQIAGYTITDTFISSSENLPTEQAESVASALRDLDVQPDQILLFSIEESMIDDNQMEMEQSDQIAFTFSLRP